MNRWPVVMFTFLFAVPARSARARQVDVAPPPPPAAPAPPPFPAPPSASEAPASASTVPLSFVAEDRTVELLEITRFAHPAPGEPHRKVKTLCFGSCTKPVSVGGHSLALRQDGARILPAGRFDLSEPATLRAEYTSHAARRILGVPALILGVAGGVALFSATIYTTSTAGQDAEFAGGAGLIAGGVAIGYFLMTTGDTARLVPVLPAAQPALPSSATSFGPALPAVHAASYALRF